MDFGLPKQTCELLARARELVESDVIPLEPIWAARGFGNIDVEMAEVRRRIQAAELWTPQLPREIGGLGLGLLEHGLMSEVMGQSPLGHFAFGCQAPDAGNAEILHKFGSPEQKQHWLLPLVAGQLRSCFSMTEPENPGSNPTQLACRAVRDGAEYVIDGHKWFTSSADGAAFAIVMAVTNPEAAPHQRASLIIVPTDTAGFERVRNISVMGHSGSGYFSHAEIRYRNCRVPVSNLLGREGAGFVIAQERLGPGRIHHCMRWIGICERAFSLMCARASARRLGDNELLGDKQIVRSWIAESRAAIDAARLLVLRAAWTIDQGGFKAAREQVSLIKFHVAEVMLRVVDRAIQTHGALGITDDTLLAFFYAHERGARIYDGPDEVHKMVAARSYLQPAARVRDGQPDRS
jgi:alkylation response protein AidB-like acyl-CoA dehydrogenase